MVQRAALHRTAPAAEGLVEKTATAEGGHKDSKSRKRGVDPELERLGKPEKGRGRKSGRRREQTHRNNSVNDTAAAADPAFQEVLRRLKHGDDEGTAFEALEEALARGAPPSINLARRLTEQFGRRSLPAGLRCASLLPMQGCRNYVSLLRLCEIRASVPGAQRVIQEMCADPRISTPQERQTALICAFQSLARIRKPDIAVEVLEGQTGGSGPSSSGVDVADSSSLVMVNNFLNALATDVDLAIDWFRRLQRRGFVPNLVSHNTMLKACMRSRRSDHADAIMDSLVSWQLKGDEYTYASLIKAFTYSSDIARAMQVRAQMLEAVFPPTPKIWGALIIASSRVSLENAFALWREMRQQGVAVPSIQSLEALMHACSGAYQGERALQLLRTAQEEGIELSQRCYNIAVKACGAAPGVQLPRSQLDLGFGLLDEMQEAGFAPDLHTYTSLFILCAQAKEGERALQLYMRLKESRFSTDAMACTALISALGTQSTTAGKIMLVFNDMVAGPQEMQPTDRTYRTVISLCCESGLLEEALQVYRVMRSVGCKPSPQQFNMLTQACAERALEEGHQSFLPAKMLEILGLGDLYELDLHRLSASEARAVVLCGMLNLQQAARRGPHPTSDLVIITGQGNHSVGEDGPKLGATIAQLLAAELRLEVRTEGESDGRSDDQKKNYGRLVVPRASLAKWLEAKKGTGEHQETPAKSTMGAA